MCTELEMKFVMDGFYLNICSAQQSLKIFFHFPFCHLSNADLHWNIVQMEKYFREYKLFFFI